MSPSTWLPMQRSNCPRAHGVIDIPSGRFLSKRDSPQGSRTEGTFALAMQRLFDDGIQLSVSRKSSHTFLTAQAM